MLRLLIASLSTLAYLATSFFLPQSIQKGLQEGFVVQKYGVEVTVAPTFPTDTPTPTYTYTFTPEPTPTPEPPPPTPTPVPPRPAGGYGGGRYIDINLSTQYLTAIEDGTAVMGTYVSTGVPGMDTPTGTYYIYARYASQWMSGPGYSLPGVPYVQYFVGAYSLHGTYWHSNFGTPMSHGCVNLPTWAAEYLWNWATYGTPVVIHY